MKLEDQSESPSTNNMIIDKSLNMSLSFLPIRKYNTLYRWHMVQPKAWMSVYLNRVEFKLFHTLIV
jgi:hypothetical protein